MRLVASFSKMLSSALCKAQGVDHDYDDHGDHDDHDGHGDHGDADGDADGDHGDADGDGDGHDDNVHRFSG